MEQSPSSKVGSVIVDPKNRVVSLGYNGLPQAIVDEDKYLNDRELEYSVILHAERNSIIFAQRDLSDCTVYTTPFLPCSVCASMIVQAGISKVVSYALDPNSSQYLRWDTQTQLAKQLLAEAGVIVVEY